jgi:GxxExxY protein
MFYPVLNNKIRIITEAVYCHLGPGLPDNVYRESFIRELQDAGIFYEKDPFVPIDYKGRVLDTGLYACFIIDSRIVLYIKNSSKSTEYHKNQLNSYMKLSGKLCGMILDFNSRDFSGVMRVFMMPGEMF